MLKPMRNSDQFKFFKPFSNKVGQLTGHEKFKVVDTVDSGAFVIYFARFHRLVLDFATGQRKRSGSNIIGYPIPYLFKLSLDPALELVCGKHDGLLYLFATELVIFSKNKKFFKANINLK